MVDAKKIETRVTKEYRLSVAILKDCLVIPQEEEVIDIAFFSNTEEGAEEGAVGSVVIYTECTDAPEFEKKLPKNLT